MQAYARPKVLKEYFGIEEEPIDYILAVSTVDDKLHKKEKQNLLGLCYQIIYQIGIFFFCTVCKKNLQQRKQIFMRFMQEIPHSKISYTIDSIQKSLSQYSAFI